MALFGRSLLVVLAVVSLSAAQTIRACSPITMSDQCNCGTSAADGLGSVTFVSCSYMQLTAFPRIQFIPNTTESLILSSNQISRIFASDLSPLNALRVLDLRRNNISTLLPDVFTTLSQLRTLYLDNNLLSTIPAGLFAIPSARMTSLFLGSNFITMLPNFIFANLTMLVDLHLENNRLSLLTSNILRGMTRLAELMLHRNQLTALPSGLFADQASLRTLRLDINNFVVIPPGTFSSFRGLTTLGMAGNPSFCTILNNVTTCSCAFGYVGSTVPATHCLPIDCGPRIPNLHPNATAVCVDNTRYLGTPCNATCNPGYIGNATYTCSPQGVWTGSLTCTPRDCGSAIIGLDPNATAVCTTRTFVDGTPCAASCRAGFVGGSAQFFCNTSGLWQGSLRCLPQDCGRTIIGLDPNARASCAVSTFPSTCRATCVEGFVGGPADFTCGADAIWRGFISCVGRDCGRTLTTANGLHPNATARCRGDTTFRGRSCFGACNAGFTGAPFEFVCQQSGEWGPRAGSMACDRVSCGANNITVENATSTCPNFRYTDTCVVSCLPGYRNASAVFTCAADASWRGNLTCPPINCGSVNNLLDVRATARCAGSLFDRNETLRGSCAASCRPGFELIPDVLPISNVFNNTVTYSCRENGWVGPNGTATPYCRRIDCGAHPATLNTSVYNVSCSNTLFEGSCAIRCASGLVPSGVAFTSTCHTDGTWLGDFLCMQALVAPVVTESSSSNVGLVAGIAAGIVVLVLLVLLAVILARRRRNGVRPSPVKPVKPVKRTQISSGPTDDIVVGTMTDNPLHLRNMVQESDMK